MIISFFKLAKILKLTEDSIIDENIDILDAVYCDLTISFPKHGKDWLHPELKAIQLGRNYSVFINLFQELERQQ